MSAKEFLTTAQAADRLAVPFWFLNQLLRERAIGEPARHGNRFLWTAADIARASAVITARRGRRQSRQQQSTIAARG
jgi:hypothetical protein